MSEAFDRMHYMQVPVLDVPSTIALSTALLAATPDHPPEGVREARNELRAAARTLEAAWKARLEADHRRQDPRPLDREVDRAWSALFAALDALANLPGDRYPRAARAERLRDQLFPPAEGLTFVNKPFRSEWTEIKRRIDLVAQKGLEREIESLVGREFLQEIHRTFEAYGKVLGITDATSIDPQNENLLNLLRETQQAIAEYNFQILSMLRPRRPETLEMVRSALRPIDDFRNAFAPRNSGSESEATPSNPTPPPPVDPKPT